MDWDLRVEIKSRRGCGSYSARTHLTLTLSPPIRWERRGNSRRCSSFGEPLAIPNPGYNPPDLFCSLCSNSDSEKIPQKFIVAVSQGFSGKTVLALAMLLASCLYDNKVT